MPLFGGNHNHPSPQPPAYPQQQQNPGSSSPGSHPPPPPAGNRIPCNTNSAFPNVPAHATSFRDLGGEPVFVASAIFGNGQSVHPCKAGGHLQTHCSVPWGGGEHGHQGQYDVLPMTADMEWVPTRNGEVPPNRRPVEGGFEESGPLYHAAGVVQGVRMPGKTGRHLGGANFAFGGAEVQLREYEILVWRF